MRHLAEDANAITLIVQELLHSGDVRKTEKEEPFTATAMTAPSRADGRTGGIAGRRSDVGMFEAQPSRRQPIDVWRDVHQLAAVTSDRIPVHVVSRDDQEVRPAVCRVG